MNLRILTATLLIVSQAASAQKSPSKIDKLATGDDVEKLVHTFKDYKEFRLLPVSQAKNRFGAAEICKEIADSLGITEPFYKADFDNNGYTDLLVIGQLYDFRIFVIMNYGGDSLPVNWITRRSFQQCTFPVIIHDSIIRYHYFYDPALGDSNQATTLQSTDLIYKFDDFIEYNPQPRSYSIEKIEFQTTRCYGSCPVFQLSISKDKSARFKAQAYNSRPTNSKEIRGNFNTILKAASFYQIIDLLNYLDFPTLKNDYTVNWTDDQTCTLIITYDNGQVKTIKDYGLIGTFGLDRVYDMLFKLRFNQDWK